MNNTDSAAILQRLINRSPANSHERNGYQAEQIGQDSARTGCGYDAHMFSNPWLQRRYQHGYDEAQLKARMGEMTLSPLEVVLLCDGGNP